LPGYQALAEGAQLQLVDLDGATFLMLANYLALLSPLSNKPQDAQDAVERALGECEHRAALYMQMEGFPESLEQFNRISVRHDGEPLPRLLVVLDEFSALVTALGGPKSSFANQVAELGWCKPSTWTSCPDTSIARSYQRALHGYECD
jgi:DNA segregation ATPase FtsK/SpoIIIE-like protein